MHVLTSAQPHSQERRFQVQPQEALATEVFSKSPWQLHMQERLVTGRWIQGTQARWIPCQQLGSGAQSIQSKRSVPPIPVVCQCKCLDDQGCWPVLPTRTAVVARLEKRQTRSLVLRQEHYARLATLKDKKSISGGGSGDEAARARGPAASIFSKILAWSATCKTISTNSAVLGTSGHPAHDLVGCSSRVRYCGCKVIVRGKSRALRGLGIDPTIQIPMNDQCKMSENRVDGPRLHVPGLAIG